MAAYWLTYKPLNAASPRGWPAEELSELVRRFDIDPANTKTLWRIASHQSARMGDRVYLFKQGADPRGIFGVGEIVELPRLQKDPTDTDEAPRYRTKIRFDRLVDPAQEFLIELSAIDEIVPETLITTQASGIGVPEDVAIELEKRLSRFLPRLPAISSEQADDPGFDPDSVKDERERAIRAIRLRRGQPAFRAALLEAYGRRCAITGCAVEDVLEAAHITPYLGSLTNHVSNGLLLRADLHTLFDCGLLAVEPKTRTVVVAESLKASAYAKLIGKVLRQTKVPVSAPSRRNLEKRYGMFELMIKTKRTS
jgi:putative restriction endonuclease